MTIKNLHFTFSWGNKARIVIEDSDGVYHRAVTIGDTINGSPIVAFQVVTNINVKFITEDGKSHDWDDETIVIKRLS